MIRALPAHFVRYLQNHGVESFELSFEGGSDEGYLTIHVNTSKYRESSAPYRDLQDNIESWADEAYSYSGAGDGTRYGDRIFYDLINKTVGHTAWYYARHEIANETSELKVDQDHLYNARKSNEAR